MKLKIPKIKCNKCGFVWTPRKAVLICPDCKVPLLRYGATLVGYEEIEILGLATGEKSSPSKKS